MSDDDVTLVCVPVSVGGIVAHGSVKRSCARCATAVWVAPSGVDMIAMQGATPVCIPCAATTVTADDELMPVTERQLAEVAATLDGHRRRN